MQLASRPGADPRHVLHAAPDVLADELERLGRGIKFLERAGQGADAACHARGNQLRQQIEQQVGIGHPLWRGPVGPVNLFLDPRAVELAVGKAIDGKDVARFLRQPAAKLEERPTVAEFGRGAFTQAQANRKRLFGTDPLTDGQGMVLK